MGTNLLDRKQPTTHCRQSTHAHPHPFQSMLLSTTTLGRGGRLLLSHKCLHHVPQQRSSAWFSTQAAAVQHIVMFRLKEDTTAAQKQSLQDGLLALPSQCPQIITGQLGVDLELPLSQANPLGPNRHLSWSATFASTADYEAYHKSEAHQALVNDLLKPILEPGSRAAIQYEIKE
mgnify:CR=1 FL=1